MFMNASIHRIFLVKLLSFEQLRINREGSEDNGNLCESGE